MYTCQCLAGYTGDDCETSESLFVMKYVDSLNDLTSRLHQILTIAHLILAPMAERALMELTISLVSAVKATPETNAKQVSDFCYEV